MQHIPRQIDIDISSSKVDAVAVPLSMIELNWISIGHELSYSTHVFETATNCSRMIRRLVVYRDITRMHALGTFGVDYLRRWYFRIDFSSRNILLGPNH